MSFDLDRFIRAQDSGAFTQAIAELSAGAKRSHWIWFVFPQLAGLGSSPMAQEYGVQGPVEAAAYLRHPILRDRLLEAMNAVRAQSAPLRRLMGSEIDTLKLMSSMTLFREAGKREEDREIASAADDIIARGRKEGLAECGYTTRAFERQA